MRVSRVAGREGDSFISPEVQEERIGGHARAHGHEVIDYVREFDMSGGTEGATPTRWVVEDFAAQGALTLLAAPAASGKTWLALQLADAVATGKATARLNVEHGRVLIVDAENGPEVIRDRFQAAGYSAGAADRLHVIDGLGMRLDREGDRAELREAIRQTGATLVFLDSLRRLAPGVHEDSSDDMAPLVAALAGVARETGAAVVAIHHRSTKRGSAAVRGSSAIVDQVDLAFTLTRNRRPHAEDAVLASVKFRLSPEPEPRHLAWSDDRCACVARGARRRAAVTDDLAGRIGDLAPRIRADGSWSPKQLGNALGLDVREDAPRKRLQRALAALVDSGAWTSPRRGQFAPAS